jgi:hypothetical protein
MESRRFRQWKWPSACRDIPSMEHPAMQGCRSHKDMFM